MNENQKYCIEMLEEWVFGAHHLPKVKEWGRGVCVNYRGDLSTFDGDRLTRLVILAHRRKPPREGLRMHEYHPTLSDLTKSIEAQISNTKD